MEQHISVPKTARYFLNTKPSQQKTLWFVFHGYGQLAKYFVRKFDFLDPDENLVVAPEGMHRFYLEGFRGRVGASWMSKEDRLNDIKDSNAMLDLVKKEVESQFEEPPKFRVVAFSQGVATAIRWLLASEIDTVPVVLWGGVFPPDVEFDRYRCDLENMDLQVVVGDKDQFYQGDRRDRLTEAIVEHEIPHQVHVVSGVHDIDKTAWSALEFL